MVKKNRLFVFFMLIVLVLALPATALANKRIYKAALSTGAELHTVVGSTARGSAVFGTNQDGSVRFSVSVYNLTGTPTGAHIHAPATTSENAGVVVTLCGSGPGTAVVATCSMVNGVFIVEGTIRGSHLNGISGADFFSYLDDGLAYINVHTSLNPVGEARGQIYLQ